MNLVVTGFMILPDELLNGLMHGDEFRAVRERGFDLDIWNHLGDAIHHISFGEHIAAFAHELSNGFAISRTFHHSSADEGNGFWVIELQAACFAALCQQGSCEEEEFVFFAGGEFHGFIIWESGRFASALPILVHAPLGVESLPGEQAQFKDDASRFLPTADCLATGI
jgi:hypothetical protein